MVVSERALQLFHKAVAEVPAYRDYLRAQGFDASSVRTVDDFVKIPFTNKKDYLQGFDRDRLVWPDSLKQQLWFCATSGSTGEPYYFPRDDMLSWQSSFIAEMFLRNSSYGGGRTLVIIGFGMGVWIGGIITLRQFEIAATRLRAPVSFLPTGYNKTEIFKALKKLAPEFEQTVLIGYPPFIKEVVDEAPGEGIDLKRLNMRLMFAAEAFTETFRKYVCEKAGIRNPITDTLNVYGTADIGAVAHETPLSILTRRLALEDPLLYRDIFGQLEKTPTLAQFNPDFIEFEEVNGQIILTGNSAMPLIRYAVGDHGGVFGFDHLEQTFRRYGVDLAAEIKRAGIDNMTNRHWPFVFVYERSDLSATLHGIIIYPEFVKEGLLRPELAPYFTERFTMYTKNDIRHNQFLQINLELQKGVEASAALEERALAVIRATLIEKSSEFSEVSKARTSRKLLQVVLWTNGHPRYFAPGTKQKWAIKA